MKEDLELIVHKLPESLPRINLYPIGDMHIGSTLFDETTFKRWKKTVLDDPFGYVVIVGDMMENGLKRSKTNCYESLMHPFQQKEWLKENLADIADRILGVVDGNHERRSAKETHDYPLYDVLCKFNKEDLFRPNMAFIKLNFGKRTSTRQVSYNIVLSHGASKSKTQNFAYCVDGMDVFVTGHLHDPLGNFPAKLVIDPYNEVVRKVDIVNIKVPSFTDYGGYVMEGLYQPTSSTKFPVIMLNGSRKEVNVLWM